MPLSPTSLQERFFALAEKHGHEESGNDNDRNKRCLFFLALRKEQARREFFSLFDGRDGEDEPPEGNAIITEDASFWGMWGIVMRFSRELEHYGLDDFKTVRGIQELIQRVDDEIGTERIASMQALINVEMSKKTLKDKEEKNYVMEDHSTEIFAHAVELLERVRNQLQTVGTILEEHGIMEAASQVLIQIEVCINTLRGIEVQQNGRTYTCSLPQGMAVPFPLEDRQLSIEEQTIQPHVHASVHERYSSDRVDVDAAMKDPAVCSGYARALYLKHLGLDKYLEYFQLLAVLIEYAASCKKQDGKRYGAFPTFLTEADGLTFRLNKLVHPQWARSKPFTPKHERKFGDFRQLFRMFRDEDDEGSTEEESSAPEQEKPKDPVAEAREKLWAYCEEKGLLRRIKKGEHKDSLRWREGLRRNSVIAELERYGAPDNLCEEMLAAYDDYAFNPFHHVALDSRERIKILTGANSNGKSTLMRSIALALNTGMVGRKIQAKGSEMSFCDGIFHDFEVHDDVQEGVSTFRAQVRNVLTFLRDGTPYSLGLFDEMYHGTSSLYLLALAWATIESFSQRNLRAIISTHEPLLTFSTRGDGLSLLRGIYAKQKKMIGGAVNGGIEGVGNISLRNHYELRPGAVMDSDAFRVAREEKMPTKLLRRAAHIKEVLMDEGAQ